VSWRSHKEKEKGPESVLAFRALKLLSSFVLENYAGTTCKDTARRSEASSPTQQHAQVDLANTMKALSHAAARGVKRAPSCVASLKDADRPGVSGCFASCLSRRPDATTKGLA
jgi:hypothetical protein